MTGEDAVYKGVLFVGGEAPAPGESPIRFNDYSLRIAADSGYETACAHGVLCHQVVGDMDSLSDTSLLDDLDSQMVQRYPQEKDETDAELGLGLLHGAGCTDVCIFGGGGGRFDHEIALLALFERSVPPMRWLTRTDDRICLDESGAAIGSRITLSMERDTLVSVVPLGCGPWRIHSKGLKWELDSVQWHRGYIGISNRAVGGNLELLVSRGRFLIIVPLNAHSGV